LSKLLAMVHHLRLGLRVGQQLTRTGIGSQHCDAAEHALPRQCKYDRDRPVNALRHRQLRSVAAQLRAQLVDDVLRDPLTRGERRDV
jgi:hypothetical protein